MNLLTRIQTTETKFLCVVLGGTGQISVTERSERYESILPMYKEYKIAEMISSGIYNE